ncbi:hypothetical protein BLOT_012437 [Blomia tropicalis]|nr:hypothetical protein BLOT_012437 [Blomia tropicalis]
MVCMETATTTTNSVLQQWTSTGRIFSNEFEIFKLKFNFKSTFNRKTHKLSWVASMCKHRTEQGQTHNSNRKIKNQMATLKAKSGLAHSFHFISFEKLTNSLRTKLEKEEEEEEF